MNRSRNTTTFYQQHRHILVVVLFVVSTLVILSPLLVSAQSQQLNSHAEAGGNAGGNSIAHLLYRLVSGFFGWLAGMAGGALSYSIDKFVVGFGALFADSGVGGAVNMLWGFVRDLFNLAFIFGLIFIGFKLILNSSDSRAKKNLASLIVAALLVNFSLFFTKFVIDFTNIAAFQFVQLIQAGGGATIDLGTIGDSELGGGTVSDIGGIFIGISGILTLFDNGNVITDATTGGAFAYIFGMMVLLLITTMVFLAGAVLLAIRFVVLNFYMIFSPIMFLGWVFPNMSGYSETYMRNFLGKAFVAPAYLLLLYISFLIIEQLNGVMLGDNTMGSMFGEEGITSAAIVPFYVLSCIFMIASVVVAQKLGADGATASIRIMNNVRGRTQRGLQNAALYTPRASARAATGAAARGLRRVDNRLLASGVTFGARARDKALKSGENARFGLQYSSQDNVQNVKTQRKRAKDRNDIETRFTEAIEAFTAMNNQELSQEDRSAARARLGATMNRMSSDEVMDLARRTNNPSILTSPEVAAAMTEAQVKAADNSGNYTNAEMGDIRAAREVGTFNQATDALDETATTSTELNESFEALGRTVRSLNKERLESMNTDAGMARLTDARIAMNLTQSQMDTIRDSGRFTPDQFRQIEQARSRGMQAMASEDMTIRNDAGVVEYSLVSENVRTAVNNSAGQNGNVDFGTLSEDRRARMFTQSSEQAGQLPVEVYTNADMAQYITPQALQNRMRNGRVSEEQRALIERNIRQYITLGTPQSERARRAWQQWSLRTTEGASFDFTTGIDEAGNNA